MMSQKTVLKSHALSFMPLRFYVIVSYVSVFHFFVRQLIYPAILDKSIL